MKTKVSAKVKSVVREGSETFLTLTIESPYHPSKLKEGDSVYVKVSSGITGTDIDFHPMTTVQKVSEPEKELIPDDEIDAAPDESGLQN